MKGLSGEQWRKLDVRVREQLNDFGVGFDETQSSGGATRFHGVLVEILGVVRKESGGRQTRGIILAG